VRDENEVQTDDPFIKPALPSRLFEQVTPKTTLE
jgi:hypothetical protein